MKLKRTFLVGAFGIAFMGCLPATPSTAGAVHLALPSEHYRLPNGLEVVLQPDTSFDAAIVDVRYHVGSKDDPDGKSGFAHLQEHLTFRGGRKGSTQTISSLLDSYGLLGWNAFTTNDETEYYELLAPTDLPRALWLEAVRMSSTLEGVTDDVFVRERDVVKNEYRQNYETQPYGLVRAVTKANLFPAGHPYHRTVIGDPHDLDRSTLSDARTFAKRFYSPRNATLVVAGNIDVPETKALVERYFGGLPPGQELPTPRTFAFPELPSDKIIHMEADVDHPRLVLTWAIPPPHAKAAYEANVVGGELTGIVGADLTWMRDMAQGVSYSVDWGRLGSSFSLNVDLRRGTKPEIALASIEAVRPLITSSFVQHAAAFVLPRTEPWLKSSVAGLANLRDRARSLQDFTEHFGWPDAADYELARFEAARRPGAAAAGAAFFDAHKVVVIVKAVPGAPRAGRVVP